MIQLPDSSKGQDQAGSSGRAPRHYLDGIPEGPQRSALELLNDVFREQAGRIRTMIAHELQGCRELWLQGEVFLKDPGRVRIDEAVLYRQDDRSLKADLRLGGRAEAPGVVAELKVVTHTGARKYWDAPDGSVRKDLERLRRSWEEPLTLPPSTLRLLIVVVSGEGGGTASQADFARELLSGLPGGLPLGEGECELLGIGPCEAAFRVRVWKIGPPPANPSR